MEFITHISGKFFYFVDNITVFKQVGKPPAVTILSFVVEYFFRAKMSKFVYKQIHVFPRDLTVGEKSRGPTRRPFRIQHGRSVD